MEGENAGSPPITMIKINTGDRGGGADIVDGEGLF